MANAEIVAIGSELLLGQIVDTNSAWIAQRLTNLGVNLFYKTVVGDNQNRMEEVISKALDRSDVVITGGGLGPTQDDVTREVIAAVTGRELVRDPKLIDEIEQRFRSRGFTMTANNERQADIPQGAIPVHNPNGTAPAFIVEDPRGVVFALPGVPHELKWLFEHEVEPYLRKKFGLSEVITYRILKVADIGESSVDHQIGHLIAGSSNPTVGVLAHPGQVDIRIAAKASSIEAAQDLIDPVEQKVRSLLGRHIFGVDDETLEQAVGKLLREQNLTLAVYEDVTSGMVAERLQQASDAHFLGGVICNDAKSVERLLAAGSSSERTSSLNDPNALVAELASAVCIREEADWGLAVHGVPEPGQRSHNLGKGATYLSITDGKDHRTRTYNIAGRGRPDRTRISLSAIQLVRLALLEGIAT